MQYIRKAEQRGHVDFGWLQSNHSFSFGSYYDPAHMGVSVLRVINDDVVQPGRGFDTHGHRDMEIISYVIDGALEHKDSTGNSYIVPAGDVQRMSAGSGVMHSEYNASDTDPVNFLQIWIQPKFLGISPSYEQTTIKQQDGLTPLVTPDGRDGSLTINQDASLYRLQLQDSENFLLDTDGRIGYLHLVKGKLKVDDQEFSPGDAFSLALDEQANVSAVGEAEALWFDLPAAA